MTAPDTSLVGQLLLGRYRVLRRLALGGMGAVYLARTEGALGFSKPVVIKRILPIWGGDQEVASLFAREARILSQLQDPGIVSVIDFGQIQDGTLVTVLDYVHGYHLAHWLSYLRATEGRMPVEMAVHIMLRVLSALQYAHSFTKTDGKQLAVIHRDVSPTNILLDTSGNVKLVDFGIARAEGDNDEYKTEAPALRGKFGYLAPELFTGEAPSPQSDVYAAGVVLYEILTGDNPFRGREVVDSYHKALNAVAPPVHTLRDDVSEALSAVVDRAIARDRGQRFASASEFADALRPERPLPDEVCQARLRGAVQVAFAGPLADTLGVEPLSASDEAWRAAVDGDQDLELALLQPTTARVDSSQPPDPDGPRAVTHPLPRSSSAPGTFAAQDVEAPTLHRSLPTSGAPEAARSRWLLSAAAALLMAVAIVALVRVFDNKPERVIVIEREPNAIHGSDKAAASATVSATATPPNASEAPAATSAVKPTSAPVEPEPDLLTHVFAREQSRIQRCFSVHASPADSTGQIMVEFRVAASGVVESVQLSTASKSLHDCLLAVAKTTHFPRLTRAVTFRIPIQARVALR